MSDFLDEVAVEYEKTVAVVREQQKKREDEYWTGFFGPNNCAGSDNKPGAPGFSKSDTEDGYQVFLIANSERTTSNNKPSHKLVAVKNRYDEAGKPLPVGPLDSHGFEIASLWRHTGKKGDKNRYGQTIQKDFDFLSGEMVDFQDAESLKLIKGGISFSDRAIKRRQIRINKNNKPKGPGSPRLYAWVEKLPTEDKKAQDVAGQVEESDIFDGNGEAAMSAPADMSPEEAALREKYEREMASTGSSVPF